MAMENKVVIQKAISSCSPVAYRNFGLKQIAPSVYGGAGGYGIRVSPAHHYAPTYSFQVSSSDGVLLSGNEKMTMQNLNDRLSTYLNKVRALENANAQLEIKIKEYYNKSTPGIGRDFSKYFQIIQELQGKIHEATQVNGRLLLQVDNAKLAADDFRMKFETELSIRQSVEADIQGLRKLLDDLTMKKANLEFQIESLREELVYLKKNHATQVEELSRQLGGSVSVEVDAAPGVDLMKIMADMRAQYDGLVEKNRQEAKLQFEKQKAELLLQVTVSTEELTSRKSEVTDVRRIVQGLEIELQSQLSMKSALEGTLANTEARYASVVAQIQAQIRNLEAQLGQIRADMEQQRSDYSMLLNIKLRLEMEIEEYRRLLDGEEGNWQLELRTREELTDPTKQRKIKTIVEEVVDGKVVSSQVQEVIEKM